MVRLQNRMEEKRVNVKENIRYCKDSRERLVREIDDVNEQLENNSINKKGYDDFFNQRFDGKTRLEWLDFCNRYIEEKGEAANQYKKEVREKIYRNIKPLLPISAILILLATVALLLPLKPTGFVTLTNEFNYTDAVSLAVNNNHEYVWLIGNYGSLKSVRLDGSFVLYPKPQPKGEVPKSSSSSEQSSEPLKQSSRKAQTISKNGAAKVYLEYSNKSYLVFDSLRLSEKGIGKVSGLVAGSETIEDENEPIINNSLKSTENKFSELYLTSLNKTITITAQGWGSKDAEDVFEFKVSSSFNWDVSYDKVCTKWDINSVSLCYGSSDCCALIGLEPAGRWNDSFYLSYGRYDSGLLNVVKAQVIYTNYSLDIENPYSDVVYSSLKEMEAEFYEARISFADICIETCLLPGFNESSYKLVFIVENGSLQIDNIRYSIEKEINISENAPSLIKEIENITLYKDGFVKINLSSYFYDKDGDRLAYTAYEADNISGTIIDNIALLAPSYNFTGKRHMHFTAYDGYYNISSNIFLVNVMEKPLNIAEVNISEELVKPRIIINEPVRWVKIVNASDSVVNLSVNISSDALNVSVRDIKENKIISEDKIKVIDDGVMKDSSVYRAEKRIEQIEKVEDKLHDKKIEIIVKYPTAKQEIGSINQELLELQNEKNRLTGYSVAVEGKGIITRFFEWLFNVDITGYAVKEKKDRGKHLGHNKAKEIEIIIEEPVEDIEVVYYTEAPTTYEEKVGINKIITISAPEGLNYTNISAYTNLSVEAASKAVHLYHLVDNAREEVGIEKYDLNNNSLVDYVEWVVPHLSNQTYELVIEISKAEHLDANRSFIADIYEYVKELDGNWSPVINSGEYVRVTFEQNLTSERDITIYARDPRIRNDSIEINGAEVPLDVYQKKMRIDEIRRILENE